MMGMGMMTRLSVSVEVVLDVVREVVLVVVVVEVGVGVGEELVEEIVKLTLLDVVGLLEVDAEVELFEVPPALVLVTSVLGTHFPFTAVSSLPVHSPTGHGWPALGVGTALGLLWVGIGVIVWMTVTTWVWVCLTTVAQTVFV